MAQPDTNLVVTGGSHGLGREIIKACSLWADLIYNVDQYPPSSDLEDKEVWVEGDIRYPALWRNQIKSVTHLINNAGVNGINYLEAASHTSWDEIIDTNTKGIFLLTQEFLTSLRVNKGTVLNIISNASHVPMTASLAYNASKAAAHVMTLQLARELTKKHDITVFGISPAKLYGTGMSKQIEEETLAVRGWTSEEERKYQSQALVTGVEIPPKVLAEFISWLLEYKERHVWLSGCVVPYGA